MAAKAKRVTKEHWGESSIANILATLPNGKTINQGWSPRCEAHPSPSESKWGVLKTTAIQPNEFRAEANKELPKDKSVRDHLEVMPGDILLTCAGPRNRCGIACRVRRTRKRLLLSGKMYRFKPDEEVVTGEYLIHFLQSAEVQQQIDRMKTGGNESGLNLTQSRFRKLRLVFPPLPEQRAIVSKLEQLFSELEDGVANLQKAQRQLKVYRQAVLKKAFEGELTREWRAQQTGLPTAEELLEQIQAERERYYEEQLAEWKQAVANWEADGKVGKKPRKPGKILKYDLASFSKEERHYSWVEVPLGFVINNLDQGWSPKCKNEPSTDEEWGVIKTSSIQRMSFISKENKTLPKELEPRFQHELKQGDILITRAGPRVRVGITCLISNSPKRLLNCDKAYRVKTKVVDKKWLVALLNSPQLVHDIEEIKSGINDSGVNLKQDVFLNLFISLCSLPEQHQIVQEIESRLSVCDQLEKDIEANLKRAERLRQSLLQKAFAGELLTEAELQACRAAPDWEPAERVLERIKGPAK